MKLFDKAEMGSRSGGVIGAAAGVILGLMLVLLGFWNTLFIALMGAVGAYIGGVKEKPAFWKKTINRAFPPKDN